MQTPLTLVSVICSIILVSCHSGVRQKPIPHNHPHSDFESFLTDFIEIWDAEDEKKLNELIHPEWGFWVIYNIGASTDPYRFATLSDAFGKYEHGFGYIKGAGFGCEPSWGQQPPIHDCGDDGISVSSKCRYGTASLALTSLYDRLLEYEIPASDAIALSEVLADQRTAEKAQQHISHFASDTTWGAVFYFGQVDGSWRLIAVDTSDCSV